MHFPDPNSPLKDAASVNRDGWGICRSEHRCIIEDDFDSVVSKVENGGFGCICQSGVFFRPQ